MNLFYKDKDYYYFSVPSGGIIEKTLRYSMKAQLNPANGEWYLKMELWNMKAINDLIKDYDIVEGVPKRKSDIKLSPSPKGISKEDVDILLRDIGLKRQLRDYQLEAVSYIINHGNCINGSAPGLGKAQPLDMMTPTPKGFVRYGDLKAGDKIFGSDGKPQLVEAIFPQGIKDCYEITFTDGSKAECCKEHLWTVNYGNNYGKRKEMTVSLSQIMERGLRGSSYINKRNPSHSNYGKYFWEVSVVSKPVEFEEREVLIDPYTLGFLIGDGSFRGVTPGVSCGDPEILDYLKFPQGIVMKKNPGDSVDYRIVDLSQRENKLACLLKAYDLSGKYSYEKEIPEDYLLNTKEVRLAVLQGLLDSDGYISKSGLVEFACTSERLTEQVRFLAESLGGVCHPTRKRKSQYRNPAGEMVACRDHYRVGVNLPRNIKPCKLKRKQELIDASKKIRPMRYIKEINLIGQKEMQCIKVSNPDHLYLCNSNFIPTHNTSTTIAYIELMDLFPCIIVCPSTVKSGWKKEWSLCNPNRTISIIGTSKKKDWSADVIVINYDLLGNTTSYVNKKGEVKKRVGIKFPEFKDREYKAIVSDEIHFMKNSKAIRSKAFGLLAKNIEVVLGLTGTLIMNRPAELSNILNLIGHYKSLFPDWEYFNYRYCNMKITPFGRDSSSSTNVEELYEIISHYCYFRKEKREVLTELPPITEQVIEMEIKNRKAYNSAEEDLIAYLSEIDIEKAEKAQSAPDLVRLQVLIQLVMEGKIKEVELFVKEWIEANEDSKLLVFGIHKAPLQRLSANFENSRLVTGDLSLSKKMSVLEEFKTDPSVQILFANIQCIGTGVNSLQDVCSDAMFIELPFRPSDLDQAVSRIERMGQKNNINVYYLLSPETIDMKMWNMLSEKKAVTDQVIKGYDDDISFSLLKSYNNDLEKRKKKTKS